MVKSLVFFIALLLVSSFAFGQESNSKSKVKLIDGSRLNVVILENYPSKYIKVQLPDNKEVTFDYSSILSIKHKEYSFYSKHIQVKGFYIEGSTSLLFGNATEYKDSRMGITLGVSANYQLNSHLSAGIGVEPTAIFISNDRLLMPVYGRFKFTTLERRVSPVFMLDTGWSFHLNSSKEEFSTRSYDGGWYLKPSIGLQINNFTLNLGYQLQKITTTEENSWWSAGITIEERLMKNVSFTGMYRF